MTFPLWILAAAAVAAATDEEKPPKITIVGLPGKKKIITVGPEGPRVTRVPILDETTLVTYTRTNKAGVVGGLVANTAVDAPEINLPAIDILGVKIDAGAIVGGLLKITTRATGSETMFPDTWTETQGELVELARLAAKDLPLRVWARGIGESGYGDNWYACRKFVFDAKVSASRILIPKITSLMPSGVKWTGERRIACLYGDRRYSDAGLGVTVVPRAFAPGNYRLYVILTTGDEVGVYLWLPPRLGLHRIEIHLVIWPGPKPKEEE